MPVNENLTPLEPPKSLPDYCAIGLSNPKSPANVGSVLRACTCFGADAVYYTGTRYDRAQKFNTNTAKQDESALLTHVDALAGVNLQDTQRVSVELVEGATPLTDFQHPSRALYIFGPEDSSLTQQTIDRSDHVIFIPVKHCLNLSATVNLLLYDRMVKTNPALNTAEYNALIRQSRDTRNHLTVKSDETFTD